jgi:hypothetical protein
MLPAASSAGVAPLWRRRARGVCAACCEPRPPQEVERTREHSKTRHNRSRSLGMRHQNRARTQDHTAARWTKNPRKKSRTHRRGSLLPSVARQRPSTATGAGRLARQAVELQPAIFRAQPARVSPLFPHSFSRPPPLPAICCMFLLRAASLQSSRSRRSPNPHSCKKRPRTRQISKKSKSSHRKSRRSEKQGRKKRRTYQPEADE